MAEHVILLLNETNCCRYSSGSEKWTQMNRSTSSLQMSALFNVCSAFLQFSTRPPFFFNSSHFKHTAVCLKIFNILEEMKTRVENNFDWRVLTNNWRQVNHRLLLLNLSFAGETICFIFVLPPARPVAPILAAYWHDSVMLTSCRPPLWRKWGTGR